MDLPGKGKQRSHGWIGGKWDEIGGGWRGTEQREMSGKVDVTEHDAKETSTSLQGRPQRRFLAVVDE